jgi:hypothetical protein
MNCDDKDLCHFSLAEQVRPDPRCRLSLLGLGGGSSGGLSGSATASGPTVKSGGYITVNNDGSGNSLSTQTLLIIAGAALAGLLIFGLMFRGK